MGFFIATAFQDHLFAKSFFLSYHRKNKESNQGIKLLPGMDEQHFKNDCA
jgi:hypothetical protein